MNNNRVFIEKLRFVGLRPTKQRIRICEELFNRKETFHFTINELKELLLKKKNQKISQATVYNTVKAFKKKGYLKEISINSEKNYFDTNTSNHHHFFNESTNELIDLDDKNIDKIKIKKTLPGKKIKSIEVLIKIANNN
jgi:Fur family iron response transcriptional regulator